MEHDLTLAQRLDDLLPLLTEFNMCQLVYSSQFEHGNVAMYFAITLAWGDDLEAEIALAGPIRYGDHDPQLRQVVPGILSYLRERGWQQVGQEIEERKAFTQHTYPELTQIELYTLTYDLVREI